MKVYIPGSGKPIWQPENGPLPYWHKVVDILSANPQLSYNELCPEAQLAVAMAYLILGCDWGEYQVYHFAEQEMQRFARLHHYRGNYLDLTASKLPEPAMLVYNILHREYCRVFYGMDTHPDEN